MHIAQIIDSLNWGGAQKMQVFLVHTLHSLGIDITIISLSERADSSIPRDLEMAGAKVVCFPFPKLWQPDSFYRLVKFMSAEKFDLVQTYLSGANIVGSLAGLITNTPVIAGLRNTGNDPKTYSKQRAFLEKICLQFFSTRVMANGYKVADYWGPRLNNIHIDVVVNAVDPIQPLSYEERIAVRSKVMGDPNRPFILSVGRLIPQKGFFDLIHAFAKVHSIHPEAVLAIAGRGRLLDKLSELVNQLGLQENILLLGVRNDARRLMGAADIYVNSSHREGTPVSILEAMAVGLPIVATTVGENSYLLKNNVGILVPSSQPELLADGLQRLLTSPEIRESLSKAARERVINEYTREAWRRNLLALYAQVSPRANEYLRMIDFSGIASAGAND